MTSFGCHKNSEWGVDTTDILTTFMGYPWISRTSKPKLCSWGVRGDFTRLWWLFWQHQVGVRKWKQSGIRYKTHPCHQTERQRGHRISSECFLQVAEWESARMWCWKHWRPSVLYVSKTVLHLIQMTNVTWSRGDLQLTADNSSTYTNRFWRVSRENLQVLYLSTFSKPVFVFK